MKRPGAAIEEGDRLDWAGGGLSARGKRIAYAATEAFLADEDEEGGIVPGSRAACDRAVEAFDHAVGRGSRDLQRGYWVLCFAIQWLPLFIVGAPSRMTSLAIDERVRYLDALESHRIGLFAMLVIAFKVPLCIPAFEEGDELASTGFDRATTATPRKLRVEAT